MAKVLHIAFSDERDNAGFGALAMHELLLMYGRESELWVYKCVSHTAHVHPLRDELVQPAGLVFTRRDWQRILSGRRAADFDTIFIHGLGGSMPPVLLQEMAADSRLVWSLDSSAPYTGGCSHTAHCRQWDRESQAACANCPLANGNEGRRKLQHDVYQLKQEIYQQIKIELLCQNDWQLAQVRRGITHLQPARVLPRLLDADTYTSGDRALARRSLGLPEKSFIILFPSDIGDGRDRVIAYLQNVLAKLQPLYSGYLVLANVGQEKLHGDFAVDELRNVQPDPAILGIYFRAADIALYLSGTEINYGFVRTAGLCALPSVVFDIGAAKSTFSDETVFLLPQFNEDALLAFLQKSLKDTGELRKVGMRICLREDSRYRLEVPQWLKLGGVENVPQPQDDYRAVFRGGAQAVREYLSQRLKEFAAKPEDSNAQKFQLKGKRRYLVDSVCRAWLRTLSVNSKTDVWDLVGVWMAQLPLQVDEAFPSQESKDMHLSFCLELRNFLVRYFRATTLAEFGNLPSVYTDRIAKLWFFVFVNTRSLMNRAKSSTECPPDILGMADDKGYPKFLLWSMYTPVIPRDLGFHVAEVMGAKVPMGMRIAILFWMLMAPSFNGTEVERGLTLRSIEEISRFLIEKPQGVSDGLRRILMEEIMVSLWRVSYLGGNNIRAIRAYADFLQYLAKTKLPAYTEPIMPRRRQKGERLRIGYVSVNFRHQAVPQYMANRLKYADHKKFFVKTFFLERAPGDDMTKQLQEWSDEHQSFAVQQPSPKMYDEIAAAIKGSRLDLLIYADIGMNNITYVLGAMRLAPVQCVLVGHGTTTGLTTIDYYVSGDHEPENAQEHYTERLVRLPNAGAAQLPPAQTERTLTRERFGIPDDAVLFISCANGLKHVASRDRLLVEILQQAPNAYILIKPFMSPNLVDWKIRTRMMAAAEHGGVADRLKVIPPLSNSRDLMPLIKLADVQLDTYPYGGWTTNLEALYHNLPIVTQEGDMARSRWGARLLEVMGIHEGIARSEDEYVAWAVRFASDPKLRQSISARIAEQAPRLLFDGAKAQPSYEKALLYMVEAKEKELRQRPAAKK